MRSGQPESATAEPVLWLVVVPVSPAEALRTAEAPRATAQHTAPTF